LARGKSLRRAVILFPQPTIGNFLDFGNLAESNFRKLPIAGIGGCCLPFDNGKSSRK
jgi:hypothetical protein